MWGAPPARPWPWVGRWGDARRWRGVGGGGLGAAGILRCELVRQRRAWGFVLRPACRAWRADRVGRGLRRLLQRAPRPAVDPALAACEDPPACLPLWSLRSAGDGGGGRRPALGGWVGC